jgi:magnesium chelatase subunit I
VQWFDLGGALKVGDNEPSAKVVEQLGKIQGLLETAARAVEEHAKAPEALASAGEFLLDGLHAHRRINRDEELGYIAEPKKREAPEQPEFPSRRARRQYN